MPGVSHMTLSLDLDAVLDQAVSSVRYNGFYFPPARHSTATFTPEYSDDGRNVKYIRADITLEFVMVEGMGASGPITIEEEPDRLANSFVNLRQRLEQPCQPLYFSAQGVGDFAIQNGIAYDVNNGPRPQVVEWLPLSDRAAKITWKVSTWFADCNEQTGRIGTTQFPFTVSWNHDGSGLLTRTISGLLEVPLTRDPSSHPDNIRANTFLFQSADVYREQITRHFPPLARFERTSSFTLSPDRRSLIFTLTDTEHGSDNPFFPGCVRVSGNRSYSSGLNKGFVQWAGTISVQVEVAPGYSRLRAWWVFARIIEDILNRHDLGFKPKTKTDKQSDPKDANKNKEKSSAYITGMSFREDLYGRSFDFSLQYMLVCSLQYLFQATGLFAPLGISSSDASWDLWRTSLANIQHPRGWIGARIPGFRGEQFGPTDDVIVDICTPYPTGLGIPATDSVPRTESDGKGTERDGKEPEAPKPTDAWIHYEADFTFIGDEGTTITVPLQSNPANQEKADASLPTNVNVELFPFDSESDPSPPITSRVRPRTYKIVFRGKAIRVGYPPSVPNLVSVGGAAAKKCGRDIVKTKVLGVGTEVATGIPYSICGLSWEKTYILDKRPTDATFVTDGHVSNFT